MCLGKIMCSSGQIEPHGCQDSCSLADKKITAGSMMACEAFDTCGSTETVFTGLPNAKT